MPANNEKTAPQIMIEALNEKLADGWNVLAILEGAYEAPTLPRPFHTDAGSTEPNNVVLAQFVMPHGGHFHLYTFVMVKPELNPSLTILNDKVIDALISLDMDERRTVDTEGHA